MSKLAWNGEGKGNGLGNRIFIGIINLAGPVPAYILLFPVILFYTLKDKDGKKSINEYYLHLTGKKASFRQIFSNFYSFGMSLVDRVSFLVVKKTFFKYSYTNEDYIEKALKEGKGAILLSAHIGNWDIAGNLLQNRLQTPINAVMVDNEKEDIKEAYQSVAEKRSFKIIPLKTDSPDTMIAIRKALSDNELVCLHGDRTIDNKGIKLPFLGEDALFPNGAFQIAVVTGAPVIPVFITKNGFRTYNFKAYDIIKFENISREERAERVASGVKTFVMTIEEIVKRRPDQWFNFYNFWS